MLSEVIEVTTPHGRYSFIDAGRHQEDRVDYPARPMLKAEVDEVCRVTTLHSIWNHESYD